MTVADISDWLDENQLLAFSLLVPTMSALVAGIASWASIRRVVRSEKQRQAHEAATQISTFRQEWINSLRDCLAEFQAISMDPNSTPAMERDFYRLGTKIELLMNPEDEDFEKLQTTMYAMLVLEEGDLLGKYETNPDFIHISQKILKREWRRLKDELRDPSKFVVKK